jgi:tetratricopeptide (TPR) repeat protein
LARLTLTLLGGFHAQERVREMIARRLDRLGEPVQELVAVAAVIGREFDFALLHEASGLEETHTAGLVEQLVRHRILRAVGERFEFAHDRIRETAYRRLLGPRRQLLHRRVAAAIEAGQARHLDAHDLAIGLHYRDGEVWERAASYLRRAGLAAAARGAHREAVACFEEALRALERLTDSAVVQAEAIDVRFDLRNSLFPLGDDRRLYEHLHAAELLAERLSDARRRGWASSYMSNYFWRGADHRRAVEAARRALAIAATEQDRRLEVASNLRLGQAYISTGDYREAATALGRSVVSLEHDMARERFGLAGLPGAFARGFLAWALAELGEFARAIAEAEEAARMAEAARDPYGAAVAAYTLGRCHLGRGDLGRATAVLATGWSRALEADLPANADHLAGALGYAHALSGRAGEGLPLLERAVREGEATSRHFHSLSVVWLGKTELLAGHSDAARKLGEHALQLASERQERGNAAHALHLLGEAASSDARDLAAHDYHRRALAIAEELGMRPLAAHCHLGLGHLHGRAGRRSEAETHVQAALSRFRELDMFWRPEVRPPTDNL